MPKVSEEHLEARREQILEGARRAFGRYGYEGATVAKLEREIALSRGAIFHYFPDKWALFYELAARDQHQFLRLLVEEGIDVLVRRIAAESPEWLGVYFELGRRLRTDPELFRRFAERGGAEEQQRADAWFEEQRRSGGLRADVDLEVISEFVSVAINGIALARSLGLELKVDGYLELLHAAIDPQ